MASMALLCTGRAACADPVVEWVADHAISLGTVELTEDFLDLAPLNDIIGDARVVSFGEGGHDSHEFWSMRNRMFAYLVEELGFTAIAVETSYSDSLLANDYVLGETTLAIEAARSVFSWTSSVYRENFELVEWMRGYNSRPETKRKIRFYGFEMSGCMRSDGRGLIDGALDFVASVDPLLAENFENRLSLLTPGFNSDAYDKTSKQDQDALLIAIQDLVSLYERWKVVWSARSSNHLYERAYRQVIAARQLAAHYRMDGEGRDIAAAENLAWVLEREGPKGRVFVFAHNMHVAKWRAPPENAKNLHSSMGEFMDLVLGDEMVVVGSLYDRGDARDILGLFRPIDEVYPISPSSGDSLNGVFAQIDKPLYLLDLSRAPAQGVIHDWFSQSMPVRNMNLKSGKANLIPSAAFDALVFIGDVTPQDVLASNTDNGLRQYCQPGQ